MTFSDRLGKSVEFEYRLIKHLKSIGWYAFPFGQGQLPEECRNRLMRFQDSARRPSRIRWMPDIITFRDLSGGRSYVALIDAKVCSGFNYAIEISAVDTALIYVDGLYTPTFFVFDDWTVLTPFDVRQRGTQGKQNGNGSGTPYLLVLKRYGQPFSKFFPAVHPATGEVSENVSAAE